MSNTWNTNGYQYDDSNYNYDAYYVAPFEYEQNAYLGVCALANCAEGSVPSLGNVDLGSVQNVSLDGMNSHKSCLAGMCSSINSTMERMGNALNIRFQKELEAGTLFLTGDIPENFDYASYIKNIAIDNSEKILNNLREVSYIDGFGDDLLGQSRIDWKGLESSSPENYQKTVEALAKEALNKDPSTWTNDDMYALYAYQKSLSDAVDNAAWLSSEKRDLKSELKNLTKAMESAGLRDFNNFKTYYIDNGIDMAAIQKATKAAMAKDPSEWTDYERAALAFTYYNLEELMNSNQTNNDISGSTKRRNDWAYYEQHSALEKLLKPAGVIPYTQDEQAWIDKKTAWSMGLLAAGDVVSALFSGDMTTAGEEWDRFVENSRATRAVSNQLTNEAIVGTVESAYDGALSLWSIITSPFVDDDTKAYYQALIAEDLKTQYADATRSANADSFEGSWIPINSAQAQQYSQMYGQMLDESAGIIVYGLFGPAAGVATAGLIGAGNAAQTEIQNVGDMNSALSILRIAQSAASNAYGTAAAGSLAFGSPVPGGNQGALGNESLVPAGGSSTALTVPGGEALVPVPDGGVAIITAPGANSGALAVPTTPGEQPTFGTTGGELTVPDTTEATQAGGSNAISVEESLGPSSHSTSSRQTNMRETYLTQAQEPETRNLVDKLYRPTADIGDGGTADVLRYELETGDLKSPSGHLNKAAKSATQIYDILVANPNHPDRELLVQLANDLIDAIPADTQLSSITNKDIRNNVRKYLTQRENMIAFLESLG